MIAQIIYMAVMVGVVSFLAKHGALFDIYTREEWEYKQYVGFMGKVEPTINKKRLEEIRNGCR